ncbi:MAG: hypothetical protein H7256_09015 [Bdellovibrio sp.]|nr:hypothetical protein [Bdellovibrio sp.]
MKINVSGLSIAFYLFCGAVIFSEYSYVGPTNTKAFYKKNEAMVELHNRSKPVSKKENWQQKASYSGNVGLNNN